jgi:hypothetical protein
MRRWLSIFLLIVLPLQISWAVAATYCQHETGSTQHIGHHDHKHQAKDGEMLAKGSVSDVDNDCAVCHAGCVAALTAFGIYLPELGAAVDDLGTIRLWVSHIDEQPERPNWPFSA